MTQCRCLGVSFCPRESGAGPRRERRKEGMERDGGRGWSDGGEILAGVRGREGERVLGLELFGIRPVLAGLA